MKLYSSLIAALLLSLLHDVAATKAVFAHFMVDNTADFSVSDWENQMVLAITAKIDAFALNIAAGSANNAPQIANAFTAANSWGFKLFFSFDYAGNGAWAKADVSSLLGTYASNGAYFHHDDSKPLVSTFEGPGSAADWVEIKAQTGCFFIPDWSSLGSQPALALENGVADGLFSWASWSWGGTSMDTYTDASYQQSLDGKPYMMAVSPWFYTNLPGYSKNWMWPEHTMSLWHDRWTEVLYLQPDYVEIISWNDFGESHYIGTEMSSPPFEDGYATFDYVEGMSHDAWRYPLAFWADQYKTGNATITEESLTIEYLIHHVEDCNDGDTTVNTASQLQLEYYPGDVLNYHYIGYTAVLGSSADVFITVGGSRLEGSWIQTPEGGIGIYHGALLTDLTGDVTGELVRDGTTFVSFSGKAIGGCTADGYANFNPWVGGDFSNAKISATTPYDVSEMACTSGTGAGDFAGICGTTCEYGYCPVGACVCTSIGLLKDPPKITGGIGYAKSDPNFDGLCSWAYNYGFKFPTVCSTTEQTLSVPTVSPFLPEACTGGRAATGDPYGVDALCTWACGYGWCPINLCKCTSTGTLVPLADVTLMDADAVVYYPETKNTDLTAMCDFACQYGNCVCMEDDGDTDTPCDLSLDFASLSDLQNVSSQYSAYCNELYTLAILSNDMTDALAEYQDVNNGYDDVFGYYVKYMKSLVEPSLADFMDKDGYTYFDCVPETCPSPTKVIKAGDADIKWTLRDSDGFYNALATDYGIEEDWITFTTLTIAHPCPATVHLDSSCLETTYQKWENYPTKADDITVTNPKDLITAAGPNLQDLPDTIDATYSDLLLGMWNGSALDAVQVVSLPVAMMQNAVASMSYVKDLGEQEEEEEKKAFILTILTVLLAIVPFVGEVGAASAGLTAVARAISLAGLAGNAALDTYTIVEDPDNAIMGVFGLLMGVGGVTALGREGASYAEMGRLRREVDVEEIEKLGDSVHEHELSVQSIVRSCNV